MLEWGSTGEGGRGITSLKMLPRTSYSETAASDILQTLYVLGCSLILAQISVDSRQEILSITSSESLV